MRTEAMTEEKVLFREEVSLTGIQEYGYSWLEFTNGIAPPPEGARFDIAFEGQVTGDAVRGSISGVDYLQVRADGKLILNLHATLLTEDGANIKVTESGINDNGNLRLNMDFHTASPRYAWLNKVQVWGIGTVDFTTGKVHITGFHI